MDITYVYTVRDVAAVLKVSTKTVYGLIQDQKLRCIWVRGQIRVPLSALEEFLKGGTKNEENKS